MLAIAHHVLGARQTTLAELCLVARKLGFPQIALSDVDGIPAIGNFDSQARLAGAKVVSLRAGALDSRLAGSRVASSELSSLDSGRRARAQSAIADHIAFADASGASCIILHGGRAEATGLDERVRHLEGILTRGEVGGELVEEILLLSRTNANIHLDRLCRALHPIVHAHANVRFALLPATSPHELLTAEAIRSVLSDLRVSNLGVWLDVGKQRTAERLGCEKSIHVFGTLAPYVLGLDLHDVTNFRERQVPGDGEVDWKMVAEHAPRQALRVLNLDMGVGLEDLKRATHVLESLDLN